jgi:hypothetical protein
VQALLGASSHEISLQKMLKSGNAAKPLQMLGEEKIGAR